MEKNRRFTIFTFPQGFKDNVLKLNILLLPRNQNPLKPAIQGHFQIPDSPSFADAKLSFAAYYNTGLDDFPIKDNNNKVSLNITKP